MSHHWAVRCVVMVIVTINNCDGQQNYYNDDDNSDHTELNINLPVSNQRHQNL
jgi:hypothetical protein